MNQLQILYRVIAHKQQRYPSPGDYWIDPLQRTVVNFRVSRMKDKRYMVLVFLHEMIEFFMCRLAGVKMQAIDKFDIEYEAARSRDGKKIKGEAPCGCFFREEPGDDPHAPYYLQHQAATQCEKLIAKALGVDWTKYNDAVESL